MKNTRQPLPIQRITTSSLTVTVNPPNPTQAPAPSGELPSIPTYAVEPEVWSREMSVLAAEYAGMPEGTLFLAQARRYMTLARELTALRDKLNSINKV